MLPSTLIPLWFLVFLFLSSQFGFLHTQSTSHLYLLHSVFSILIPSRLDTMSSSLSLETRRLKKNQRKKLNVFDTSFKRSCVYSSLFSRNLSTIVHSDCYHDNPDRTMYITNISCSYAEVSVNQ